MTTHALQQQPNPRRWTVTKDGERIGTVEHVADGYLAIMASGRQLGTVANPGLAGERVLAAHLEDITPA